MSTGNAISLRTGGLAVLIGAALLVAGCGSSSSSSNSSATTSAAATGTASGSASTGVTIATTTGSEGTYLTSGGRALYLWVADTSGKSACSGQCTKAWPPLTTTGTPSASGAAKSSDISTITRSDGTKQVTYMGHPLYFFAADTKAGQLHGQGSNSFGAKWWLVDPSGSAITSGASSAASSSGSSSGGGSSWG